MVPHNLEFWKVFEVVWMQGFRCNIKLVAMVWSPLSIKGQGTLDHRGGGLVGQSFMVGQIHRNILEEVETSIMDKSGH
jgi:hypothetical protein